MSRTLPQPSRDDIDLVTVLRALADPVRLEMLRVIAAADERCPASAEAYDVEVTAATLSHHFRVLREAGVTTTFVEGRRRWVDLRRADLDQRFPGLLDAVVG
ncbi:ArsR/SmtB family transcription factor [Actinophytocola sp.]|uniref:ArsR/SmtB family transcription factor n=1 Tax=Actinophytocola sp. TaxID=1872138 RepID=UPI002ED0ADC8